jgi:hypothetical protein
MFMVRAPGFALAVSHGTALITQSGSEVLNEINNLLIEDSPP